MMSFCDQIKVYNIQVIIPGWLSDVGHWFAFIYASLSLSLSFFLVLPLYQHPFLKKVKLSLKLDDGSQPRDFSLNLWTHN